jgi:hypothetical protein
MKSKSGLWDVGVIHDFHLNLFLVGDRIETY